MRSKLVHAIALAAAIALAPGLAIAQFGHPLKGQWSGEWGPKNNPQRLLLDMHWDGKALTGVINPGPTAAIVKNVTFDYSNPAAWKVTIEADGKDESGKPIKVTANGTLENIGSYYRVFHGTWVQGGQKGDFTVTRN
jgi:hypothetical protein